MHSLSIIIPIYNEEKNIALLYEKIVSVCNRNQYKYEVIFIDDGSTDSSGEEIKKLSKATYIRFNKNFGQTAAMMAGIDHSSGDIIIPMDGDLQNDPEDIPKLLQKIDEGNDVVSGWRKDRKDNPIKRNLPSRIANRLISIISGVHLHDYGCSLKAYKREVIKDVKLYGEMHRFIPIYASWVGAKVAEVTVTHYPRIHGVSKYGMNRVFKVILDLIVIKYLQKHSQSSIYIFGGFGFISLFLSFLSFLIMIYFKFWGGKSFIQTPLPMLVILFFMVGFLSILMGLISEMLNRTYYESQDKKIYVIKEKKN